MTDDWLEARYEKDPNIVYREIAGEAILVPIRKRAADLESIYTLNEVGARIWELIDGQRTLSEIRDLLVDEYDVGAEVLTPDLFEYVEHLKQAGAIRERA